MSCIVDEWTIAYNTVVENLTGKIVVVQTQETDYVGKLIELGEEEVHLETEMGWIVIPIERITSIREKEV